MDKNKIMRTAAEKSGMPWPLDEKARELSEMVLRGLDYGVSVAKGEAGEIGSGATGIHEKIRQWKKLAEEANRNEE